MANAKHHQTNRQTFIWVIYSTGNSNGKMEGGKVDWSCTTKKYYNVFFVLEHMVKLFRDFELHLLCT